MLKPENRVVKGWQDYALLDSGDGMKLERFGTLTLARPDTQAIWQKHSPKEWRDADAKAVGRKRHLPPNARIWFLTKCDSIFVSVILNISAYFQNRPITGDLLKNR